MIRLLAICLVAAGSISALHLRIDNSYGPWKFQADRAYTTSGCWVDLNIPHEYCGQQVADQLSFYLSRNHVPGTASYIHGKVPVDPERDIKAFDFQGNYVGYVHIEGGTLCEDWKSFVKP